MRNVVMDSIELSAKRHRSMFKMCNDGTAIMTIEGGWTNISVGLVKSEPTVSDILKEHRDADIVVFWNWVSSDFYVESTSIVGERVKDSEELKEILLCVKNNLINREIDWETFFKGNKKEYIENGYWKDPNGVEFRPYWWDHEVKPINCSDNSCKDCDFYKRVLTKEGTYVGDTPCNWCMNSPYKVTSQMQETLKGNTATATSKSNEV